MEMNQIEDTAEMEKRLRNIIYLFLNQSAE